MHWGGLGSGTCADEEEFLKLAESSFAFSKQNSGRRIVEKAGKKSNFEVIRDANDHCFTVASMEKLLTRWVSIPVNPS